MNRSNFINKNLKNIYWITAITIWIGCYENVAVANFSPTVDYPNVVEVTLLANKPIATPVEVVRNQLEALNNEDLTTAIDAIHPSSPGFQQTKEWTEKFFDIYDLRYTLQKVTLESETLDTAKVQFSQITKNISDQTFRNNRIDGVHVLKKYDGEWKIYETKVIKIEFLDNG
jgi:hypothetical protein